MDTSEFDSKTLDLSNMHLRRAAILTAVLKDQCGPLLDDPQFLDQLLDARQVSVPVALQVKAAIAAGTTTDATWAGPAAVARPMVQAFIGAVDRISVLGQLGAVKVPAANAIGATQTATATATANWIGENIAKPISALSFAAMALPSRKLAADVAVSQELLRFANADALALVERSVVSAVAVALDTALLDPANSGVANVKPASLTNGLTTIPPLLDFANQVGQTLAAISGGAPTKPVIVVSLQTALRIAALPNLTDYVRVVVSPAATNKIIAIDADAVAYVDDGGSMRAGTPDVQMNDAPDTPSTAATVMIGTWARNLKVIRGERWTNWAKRSDAVAYLTLA